MKDLERALVFVLRWEGGYVNDPADPGGATNHGITQRTYDAWMQKRGMKGRSVKLITMEEVTEIYEKMYWNACAADHLVWPVCLALFDAAVNCGPTVAIQFLQHAAGASADGIFGPKTLAAVQAREPMELAERVCDFRMDYYSAIVRRRPTSQRFMKGWTNRVSALREEIRK